MCVILRGGRLDLRGSSVTAFSSSAPAAHLVDHHHHPTITITNRNIGNRIFITYRNVSRYSHEFKAVL